MTDARAEHEWSTNPAADGWKVRTQQAEARVEGLERLNKLLVAINREVIEVAREGRIRKRSPDDALCRIGELLEDSALHPQQTEGEG